MRVLELEYDMKYETEEFAKEYCDDDSFGLLKVVFGCNEDNYLCIDFHDGSEVEFDKEDKSVVAFRGSIVLDEVNDIIVDFLYDHISDIEDYEVEVSNHGNDNQSYPELSYLKLTALEDGEFVGGFIDADIEDVDE